MRRVVAYFKEPSRNCDICSRKIHRTCVQIENLDWKNMLLIILLTEYNLRGDISNVHRDGHSGDRNISYEAR